MLKMLFISCTNISPSFIVILNNINFKFFEFVKRDHSFDTYAKFSEKVTFLTPWYAQVRLHIRGNKCCFFGKFCERTKWMIAKSKYVEKEIQVILQIVQVCSCEFCEYSENTFFTEHLWATASESKC